MPTPTHILPWLAGCKPTHPACLPAAQVGPTDHVICALSGGVDSTVAATLVHRVLGDRLHCVFVDNGLLRCGVVVQLRRACSACQTGGDKGYNGISISQ